MPTPFRLLGESGLIRRHMIVFALVTAILNGIVTASVGTYLAQSYAVHQARRQSVQGIADLIYERRARAGMVVSSLRRAAELEELRYRKRAYDEVFVEWNKRIQTNILQIREVMGQVETSQLEGLMQELLIPAMTAMDVCLTRGYDLRVGGQDPMPVIDACNYPALHQFALDCAKGLTDELYRYTNLRLMPFSGHSDRELVLASGRIREACASAPLPPPSALAAGGRPASAAAASTVTAPATAGAPPAGVSPPAMPAAAMPVSKDQ